jgi:hypothetical protein
MTCFIHPSNPCSTILLEKLTITQLVKKFSVTYGTQRFIIVFTTSPLLVPILSQMHPVHTFPTCFLKIHPNIMFLSMSMSSKWPFPFKLSNQNAKFISHISHACYMTLAILCCWESVVKWTMKQTYWSIIPEIWHITSIYKGDIISGNRASY